MAEGQSRRPLIEVRDIEALLEQRIESLVGELLPNAVKNGKEMCVGSGYGEPGQSLRIHVRAANRRRRATNACSVNWLHARSRSGARPCATHSWTTSVQATSRRSDSTPAREPSSSPWKTT